LKRGYQLADLGGDGRALADAALNIRVKIADLNNVMKNT
jgi:hypothetical protein